MVPSGAIRVIRRSPSKVCRMLPSVTRTVWTTSPAFAGGGTVIAGGRRLVVRDRDRRAGVRVGGLAAGTGGDDARRRRRVARIRSRTSGPTE